MSRILAYTSPERGHLFPVTPILDELRARGHQIAVRTLASQVLLMRDRGFDAAPVDPAVERIQPDDFRARTALGALERGVGTFARRADYDAADLRRAIDEQRPDALLVDVNTWGALAAAEAWGGPWASWCPFPMPLPSRDVPPFGPGLRPMPGPAGRLRDAAVRPVVFGPLVRIVLPQLNRVRERIGVPPLKDAASAFTAAPMTLYLTAEPFEYPLRRPVRLGSPGRAAGMAGKNRQADHPGHHVIDVPGRRPPGPMRPRRARR
jgi:UDP:flavonoid glycosyltransferase YjiC (YdhE family)